MFPCLYLPLHPNIITMEHMASHKLFIKGCGFWNWDILGLQPVQGAAEIPVRAGVGQTGRKTDLGWFLPVSQHCPSHNSA